MEETELQQKIAALELKVSLLEERKKDKWDIFNIVASLLIPASIAFAGYYFSTAIKEAEIQSSIAIKKAEIQSSKELAARQENIAIINAKVAQAELISEFLEPLTGDDDDKKRVAIRGILIALPDEGPQIVAVVSESDPSKDIQKFAKSELDIQREQLIKRAFSDQKTVRIAATTELVRGWSRDQKLVPEIAKYAMQHLSHKSGVINTLVVMQNVDIHSLLENKDIVLSFIEKAIPNGPKTASHAEKVRKRLNAS